MDEPRFTPGDRALRMGPSIPAIGVEQFKDYEVESFSPMAVDGLRLKGIGERLNADNFERLPT